MKPRPLAHLNRDELVRVGHEYMMLGHLIDRALMPQLMIHAGSDAMEPVAIEEWMGASPVYTARMRSLMGIGGDGVSAIVKSLQLDVGFAHQYMDVHYRVDDEEHAEFWLDHCGALLDAEPGGSEFVLMMCHHIEDPTFDATACATNPRARIRPVHRPPREPADRVPHCHWTITIDPEAEPLAAPDASRAVASLPLAALPVATRDAALPADDGWVDYAGSVVADFGLDRLATATLVAVLAEMQMQSHLIVSAAELAITRRFDAAVARDVLAAQWVGAGWMASERLCNALGIAAADRLGPEAVAAVLAVHPGFPPSHDVDVEAGADHLVVRATPLDASFAQSDAPGWVGLVARGDRGGIEAMARGVDPRARVTDVRADGAGVTEWHLDFGAEPETDDEPTAVKMVRISTAASFEFA